MHSIKNTLWLYTCHHAHIFESFQRESFTVQTFEILQALSNLGHLHVGVVKYGDHCAQVVLTVGLAGDEVEKRIFEEAERGLCLGLRSICDGIGLLQLQTLPFSEFKFGSG